jgi:hypothetical protein
MKKPNNQIREVLYELIKNSAMTRMDFFRQTGILNVTARIANLRNIYRIDVRCKKIHTINKHGRKICYGSWSLDPRTLDDVKVIYEKINK